MESGIAVKQMPKYKCHKEVWALKIKQVVIPSDSSAGYITLHFEDNFLPMQITSHMYAKFNPVAGWYFVVYEDGYQSFSPAKAFEEGYTLIK